MEKYRARNEDLSVDVIIRIITHLRDIRVGARTDLDSVTVLLPGLRLREANSADRRMPVGTQQVENNGEHNTTYENTTVGMSA